jgi:hypothetical protein
MGGEEAAHMSEGLQQVSDINQGLDLDDPSASGLAESLVDIRDRTQGCREVAIKEASGLAGLPQPRTDSSERLFEDWGRIDSDVWRLSGTVRSDRKILTSQSLPGLLGAAELFQSLDDPRPFQCFKCFLGDFKGHSVECSDVTVHRGLRSSPRLPETEQHGEFCQKIEPH